MNTIRRLYFAALAAGMAGVVAPGPGPAARAAGPAHDLYLCTNLSAQSAAVMGRGGPARSGLYRSADRTTFTHLGPHHIRLFGVAADPRAPATLFVAALDGMMRSHDGGRSWRILTGWDMTEPKAFAFDPGAPDHLYAGLPDGIAVSRDRGETWHRAPLDLRRAYTNAIAVDRTQAGRVLAGTELGLYLSEDGARSWRRVHATTKVTYDLRQSPHDPRRFLAVTSADGALASADRGVTWQRLPGIGADRTLHNGVFDPTDARRLAVCGWGAGLQISEDGGATWVDRTAGLPRREVWSVAADPDSPGRLYAAPYLEDLYVSDDFGRTWRPVGFAKATIYAIAFLPRP